MKQVNVDELVVYQDHTGNRFFTTLAQGVEAELVYILMGTSYALVHTGVPEEYEGQGIASKLVTTALKLIRAEGKTIIPICPFVRHLLHKDHQWDDLVGRGVRFT